MQNLTQELLQAPYVKSNRDKSLDVAKGIMMLSVVAGHIVNFPFGEVFYYYHVAGFFLLSGYFFNYGKYVDSFGQFLKSRSKLIYQYLIYSAIFIAAHNLLIDNGLQPQNYIYYSFTDYVTAFIRSITIPSEALAGAMWFIPVLILMQCIFYWINRLLMENKLLVSISVISLFFIGWLIVKDNIIADNSYINNHIPNAQFFVYMPFFYIGFIFKETGFRFLSGINILLPALVTIAFSYVTIRPTLYLYGSVEPYCFLFLSLVSISFVIGISYHIKYNMLASFFTAIGESTVHILALHFFFFKMASLLLVMTGYAQPDTLHITDGPSNGTFIQVLIYLSLGVILPLAITLTARKLKYIMFAK